MNQCSAARSSVHSGIVFTTSSKLSIVDCGAVHYREKLLRIYNTAVLMKYLCALLRCSSVAIVLYYLAHELCSAAYALAGSDLSTTMDCW